MDGNAIYDKKLKEMQKYIPFLDEIIIKIENATNEGNETGKGIQLSKIKSLKSLLTVTEKRMKIENLVRCEEILKKLEIKMGKPPKTIEDCSKSDFNKGTKTFTEPDPISISNSPKTLNFYKEYSPINNHKKQESKNELISEHKKNLEKFKSIDRHNMSKKTSLEIHTNDQWKSQKKINQKKTDSDSKSNRDISVLINRNRSKILCSPERKIHDSSNTKHSRDSNISKEKVDKKQNEGKYDSIERHGSKSSNSPEARKSPNSHKKKKRDKKNEEDEASLHLLLEYRRLLKKQLEMDSDPSVNSETISNNDISTESCSSFKPQVLNPEKDDVNCVDEKLELKNDLLSPVNIFCNDENKSNNPNNSSTSEIKLDIKLNHENESSLRAKVNNYFHQNIKKNKEDDKGKDSQKKPNNDTHKDKLNSSQNEKIPVTHPVLDAGNQPNINNIHSEFQQDVLNALKQETIEHDMPTILKNIPIRIEAPPKKSDTTDINSKTRRISFEKYKEKQNSLSFSKSKEESKIDDYDYTMKGKSRMEILTKVLTPKEIERFDSVLKEFASEDVKSSDQSNSPRDEDLFLETQSDEKKFETMYPESPDSTSSFQYLNEDSSFTSDSKLDEMASSKHDFGVSMYSNVRLSPLPCISHNSPEPYIKTKSIYSTSPLSNEDYYHSPRPFQSVNNVNIMKKLEDCEVPPMPNNPMTNINLPFNSKDSSHKKTSSKVKYPLLTSRFNVSFPVSANYKGKNPKPLLGFNYDKHSVEHKLTLTETSQPMAKKSNFNSIRKIESPESEAQLEYTRSDHPKKSNMSLAQNLDRNTLNHCISRPLRENSHLIKIESSKELSLRKCAKISNQTSLPPNKDVNNIDAITNQLNEPFLPNNMVKIPLLSNPPIPLLDCPINPYSLFGFNTPSHERSKTTVFNNTYNNTPKIYNTESKDPRIRRDLHANLPAEIQLTPHTVFAIDQQIINPPTHKVTMTNTRNKEDDHKDEDDHVSRDFKIPKVGNPQPLMINKPNIVDDNLSRMEDESKMCKESVPKTAKYLDENVIFNKLQNKEVVILEKTDTFVIYDEKDNSQQEIDSDYAITNNDQIQEKQTNSQIKIAPDNIIVTNSDPDIRSNIKNENSFFDDLSVTNDSVLYKSFTDENDFPKLLERVSSAENIDQKQNEVAHNIVKVENDLDEKSQDTVTENDKEVLEPSKDVVSSLVDVLTDKKKILNVLALLDEKGDNLPSKIKKKLKLLAEFESDEESDGENNKKSIGVSQNSESSTHNPKVDDQLPRKSNDVINSKVNKVGKRKSRSKNEVDLLREALPETYGGLDTTGIRMCRLAKELNCDHLEEINHKRVTRKSDSKRVILEEISCKEEQYKEDNQISPVCSKHDILKKELKINIEKLKEGLQNNPTDLSENINNINSNTEIDFYKVKPCPKSKKGLLLNKAISNLNLKNELDQDKKTSPRIKIPDSSNLTSNPEKIVNEINETNSEYKSDISINDSHGEDFNVVDNLKLRKKTKSPKIPSLKLRENMLNTKVAKKPVFKGKKFKSHNKNINNTLKPYNYKNYHFSKDITEYNCKYCDNYSGNEITKHYIQSHPHKEILISRLSTNEARDAISESLATSKYGFQLDDFASSNISDYQCRFCDKILRDCHISVFYEHVIHYHTGEYQHECKICSNYEFEGKSICTIKQSLSNVDPNVYVLKGFLCEKCNYTQIFKRNLDQHVAVEHGNTKCEIYEINISKMHVTTTKKEIELIDVVTTEVASNVYSSELNHNENENNSLLIPIKKEIIEEEEFIYTDTAFNYDMNIDIKNEEMPDILQLTQEINNFSDLKTTAFSTDKPVEKHVVPQKVMDQSITSLLSSKDPTQRPIKIEPGLCKNTEDGVVSNKHYKYSIGELRVIQFGEGFYKYICQIKNCGFWTDYSRDYQDHLETIHENDKWDGFCIECNMITSIEQMPYSFAFYHFSKHIKKHPESNKSESKQNISNVDLVTDNAQNNKDDNLPIITSVRSLNVLNSDVLDQIVEDDSNYNERSKTFVDEILMEFKINKSKDMQDLVKSDNDSGIFICGDTNCQISTNNTNEFIIHYQQHIIESKKLKSINNKWRDCAYCGEISSSETYLWKHIINEHGNSKYKCTDCVFRSVSYFTTFTHSYMQHIVDDHSKRVVGVKPHPGSNMLSSISGIQSKEKYFTPCVCTIPTKISKNSLLKSKDETKKKCMMKFNSGSTFFKHVKEDHNGSSLKCHYCNSEEMKVFVLIEHMEKCHQLSDYKCGYCSYGNNKTESLVTHLVLQHPNKIPIICTSEVKDGIEERRIINLEEDPYKYIKSNFGFKIETFTSSGEKGLTSYAEDHLPNVRLDQEQNPNVDFTKPLEDIINLDSDEEIIMLDSDLQNPNSKTETLQCKKKSLLPKRKRWACPEDDCSFKSNSFEKFSEHSGSHKSHVDFKCQVCPLQFENETELSIHSEIHKKSNMLTTSDTFKKKRRKCDPKESNIMEVPNEKSVHKNSHTNENTFGPDDIKDLPIFPILSYNIFCSVCSFNTKVTSNMLRHLQLHASEVSVPNAAPVNPVPHLQSNEMHFDKMTNLALSSHIDQPRVSSDKKYKTGNDKPIPQYIPLKERFVCGSKNCSYITIDENMLKSHWETLHQDERVYHCVHCKINISINPQISKFSAPILAHLRLHDTVLYRCTICNYVHGFINIIRKHCLKNHGKTCDVLVRGGIGNVETVKWICGICKIKCETKKKLAQHCKEVHKIFNPFKCGSCDYSNKVLSLVKNHIEKEHFGLDVEVIKLFRRESCKSNNITKPSENSYIESENDDTKSLDEMTTPIWWRRRKRASRFIEDDQSPQKKIKKAISEPSKDYEINETENNGNVSKNLKNSELDTKVLENVRNMFYCPFDDNFSTNSLSTMKNHLCEELNYKRWSCNICGYHAFDTPTMIKHFDDEHKMIGETVKLPVDEEKENRIKSIISNFTNVSHPFVESSKPKTSESHTAPKETFPDSLSSDEEGRLVICDFDETDKNDLDDNKTHICIKCKLHLDKHNMNDHTLICHPGSVYNLILEKNCVVFKCSSCFQLFLDNISLKRHFINLHPKEILKYELQNLDDIKEGEKIQITPFKKSETRGRKKGSGKNVGKSEESNLEKPKAKGKKGPLFASELNFQCEHCVLSFNKFCGYRRHCAFKHKDGKIQINPLTKANVHETGELKRCFSPLKGSKFTCIVTGCGEYFSLLDIYTEHVRDHYCISREYRCLKCSTTCNSSISFVDHCKRAHDDFDVITDSDSAVIDRIYQIDNYLSNLFQNNSKPDNITPKRVARKSTAQVLPSFYGSRDEVE